MTEKKNGVYRLFWKGFAACTWTSDVLPLLLWAKHGYIFSIKLINQACCT